MYKIFHKRTCGLSHQIKGPTIVKLAKIGSCRKIASFTIVGPLIWCDNPQVRLWKILYINNNDFHNIGRSQMSAGACCYFRTSKPHSGTLWHVLKLKNIPSDLIHICKPVFHHPSTFLNIFFLTFLSSPTGCKFLIKQIQNVYYAEYLRFYPQFMQIKMRICTYFSLSQQVSVTATADLLTLIFEVKVQCRSKIA